MGSLAAAPRVSIIIAARNNGKFLAEAIESACTQSTRCEVIYADDASTDDSLGLARRFEERDVAILPGFIHRGVCATRNRGAAAAKGEYLVFLDGDDRLSKDFVARHLDAMSPGVPFVYGPARAFGDGPHAQAYWSVPTWDDYDRWECNTVNTSAMYARWAFHAAGGWSDRVPTMWDWDLALRASRFGIPRPSRAMLDYRQHAESWSAKMQEKDSGRGRFLAQVRRVNARLSVGSILSGRLPGLFSDWLDALAQSVRRISTSAPKTLTLLDNSRDPKFRRTIDQALGRHGETFGVMRVIPYPQSFTWTSEGQRRDRVAEFMAKACFRLAEAMPGDVYWFVEDDVIVPLDGGEKLWDALTDGTHPPHGISGCYRNRHLPERYVGGWWRGDSPDEPKEIRRDTAALVPVDFVGTGCLMTWPSRTPLWTDSHLRGIPAHDWAWSAKVCEQRGRLYFHPQVRCAHAVSERQILPG